MSLLLNAAHWADGEIDFDEFRALARANADLEQVLRSKHFECAVAAFFPSGTTFEDVGKMDHAQFSAVVDQSRGAQIQLLVELGAQLAAVTSAQHAAAEGGKFTSELKGGTLADFYAGVTGLCGEPDADLEAGMRREHTECDDSDVAFSTSNYGITTTPRTEFELVAAGGSGCERAEGVEEGVVVPGTRGCFKASEHEWANVHLCSDPTTPHFTRGLQWQDVGATRATRATRRVASAADGGSMDWKAQGQCGRLQRDELGMDMFLSSAAPFLWTLADNDTSSSSLFPGAAWRGTRFLSIAGRSAMCARAVLGAVSAWRVRL